MVYRVYVEKKPGLDNEARGLLSDARDFLGIRGLEKVRLLNRYDLENLSESLFETAVKEVLSEPPVDRTFGSLEAVREGTEPAAVFAVEYLPGQFDQGRIPRPSASRSSARGSGPRSAARRSTCCTAT